MIDIWCLLLQKKQSLLPAELEIDTPGINHVSVALVLTKHITLLQRINAVVREKEGHLSRLLQLFCSYLMANATSKDQLSNHLYLTPAQGFSAPMTIKSASICDLRTLLPMLFCLTSRFRRAVPAIRRHTLLKPRDVPHFCHHFLAWLYWTVASRIT